MPNFTARVVSGAQVAWVDEATLATPSRQNNNPQHLASYRRINVATPQTVEIRATVGGVEAPLDGALGGDLFVAVWAEWSGVSPPPIVQAPGQSSLISATVTAAHIGHFCMSLRRPNGGCVLLHFDVEVVP